MTSYMAPHDPLIPTTKRVNNIFPTRSTECITTQSSGFSSPRMSPTRSSPSTTSRNMSSRTVNMNGSPPPPLMDLQYHHQQKSTYNGMQFLPQPPFYVQACYPSAQGVAPSEFQFYPNAVPTMPPHHQQQQAVHLPITHLSQQQHPQTYKPSAVQHQQQQQQFVDYNMNATIIPSPPTRRQYMPQQQQQLQQQQQPQLTRSQLAQHQMKNRMQNPFNRFPAESNKNLSHMQRQRLQSSSPTSSNESDDSEPVLLTRSHTSPSDATSESSSYTLATLFRNKIFVGSLTQIVRIFYLKFYGFLHSFLTQ